VASISGENLIASEGIESGIETGVTAGASGWQLESKPQHTANIRELYLFELVTAAP
jgi:hypothetical protein